MCVCHTLSSYIINMTNIAERSIASTESVCTWQARAIAPFICCSAISHGNHLTRRRVYAPSLSLSTLSLSSKERKMHMIPSGEADLRTLCISPLLSLSPSRSPSAGRPPVVQSGEDLGFILLGAGEELRVPR